MTSVKSIRVAQDRVFKDSELKLLQMTADGANRQEIADDLQLSVRTIEYKLGALKKEFGCKSIPHLIMFLARKKILE